MNLMKVLTMLILEKQPIFNLLISIEIMNSKIEVGLLSDLQKYKFIRIPTDAVGLSLMLLKVSIPNLQFHMICYQ